MVHGLNGPDKIILSSILSQDRPHNSFLSILEYSSLFIQFFFSIFEVDISVIQTSNLIDNKQTPFEMF